MDIYTIGHTNHSVEYFIKLLQSHKINCIVDVRSTPLSKYTPQFNKDTIKKMLKINGIYYIHMGKEFGARRENLSLYTSDGYLDFEKARKDDEFLKGINRIKNGCNNGFVISLMCTEKDAFDCHRGIMVSKGLKDNGFNIKHILPDNTIETQEKLEERLVNKYFSQISFDLYLNGNMTQQEMIEEGYRKRNKEIGYRIGGDEID